MTFEGIDMDRTAEMSNRELFEDVVYKHYYIKTIQKNECIPQPKISDALDYVSTAIPKSEFLEKDDEGNYKRSDVSAMWYGWCLCLDAIEP